MKITKSLFSLEKCGSGSMQFCSVFTLIQKWCSRLSACTFLHNKKTYRKIPNHEIFDFPCKEHRFREHDFGALARSFSTRLPLGSPGRLWAGLSALDHGFPGKQEIFDFPCNNRFSEHGAEALASNSQKSCSRLSAVHISA
jgi:hypothetical protein